jgi:hypothetical protein
MPLILIPLIPLMIAHTRAHRHQAEAELMNAQTARMQYELQLREYEDRHHLKHQAVPQTTPYKW